MKHRTLSERALVLAPLGRDAAVAITILSEAGIAAEACMSLAALIYELDRGAGFVVATEEALATDLHPLAAWIADQQEWSDLPFVLLTMRGGVERNPAAGRFLDVLDNVTFLERPFHPTTLVSLARSALRGRRRQYEARARLEALRESEDHYRHAVELNPQVAWTSAPNGQLDQVAQRWFEWTGTSGLGETWSEAIHPDDRERSFAAWGQSITTGEPYDIEHRVRLRSGEYHWMHSRAYARRDAAGNIIKWYGTTEDIQERKSAEEALAASEGKHRAITDSIDQIIWSTRPDGYHDYFNQRWYDYTGVPEGSTDGEGWNGMFHPDDQARAWEVWRHSLTTGEPYRIEYRLRHRSGEYRWVLGRAQPVRDETGRIVRWYGTCTDIDDEVRAREVLARSREALEREVAERTAEREAALAQLHEAQKIEMLGQLTGGVAHDFNNLLTPITGALDLLQRRFGESDPRSARLIAGALQSAERAKTLVQRLLGFARRQALQTRAVDLAALIEGMRDLVASSAGAGVELRVAASSDLPSALVDPNQLELAVLNLCVNARDAMPNGGVLTISVEQAVIGPRSKPKLVPGAYLRLSVIDTGIGMDKETLARAIEPFYSTKELGKGTGLGLSMVHGLAAQLGGAFMLSSAPGEGTRADLYLPIADEAVARTSRAAANAPTALRPLTILLVDDEELVRCGTAEMLRELGHSVTEASGGAQALGKLGAGLRVDVVVTDYMMPRMSGAELALRMRELYPEVPVLVITGYAGGDLDLGLPQLAKPFRQADLAATLQALLDDPTNVVRLPSKKR